MNNLIYTTKTDLDGPWLLSTEALKDLDAILDANWKKFETRRKKFLTLETDKLKESYKYLKGNKKEFNKEVKAQQERLIYSKSYKIIYFYYPDGSTFRCEKIKDALIERSIIHKRPTGLGIEYLCGDIWCKILTDDLPPKITIEIRPEVVPQAREAFTEICNWAGGIRRLAIGQWVWVQLASRRRSIFLIGFLIISAIFWSSAVTNTANARSQLDLLSQQGINNTNIVDAVTYLIQIQTTRLTITPWLITSIVG